MFPSIGVAAKPERGSVVFWHNKDPTGNKILESKHGGCPVLYGVKWGKLERILPQIKSDLDLFWLCDNSLQFQTNGSMRPASSIQNRAHFTGTKSRFGSDRNCSNLLLRDIILSAFLLT